VEGIELECYHEWSDNKNSKICQVYRFDLSNIYREEVFEVSALGGGISKTTAFGFLESPRIDFIPEAVVDKIPNLIELKIEDSIVPIIKNDFFTSKFHKIKLLTIMNSQTEFIEEKAFQHLKNLIELVLRDNNIESLSSALFSNNRKLKHIDLSNNRIVAISSKLFKNLIQLTRLELEGNKCVNEKLGCKNCKIDHEELDRELAACYFNCFVDNECGKNLNASVEFKCEFSEGLFEISKDLSFKSQQCKITELKFPTKSSATSELFSGSKNGKQNVTMLDINQKISIDKIPREIFKEFPSLRQIKISNKSVPVLKDNWFSTYFMKIEYLDLSQNHIEVIEEKALDNLVNLIWLNLESNELKVLHSFEFRNNKKLEYINLNNNQIDKINRRTLSNLKNLKFLQLEKNGDDHYYEEIESEDYEGDYEEASAEEEEIQSEEETTPGAESENNGCFNGSIGCSNCTISEEDLENRLGECYRKYYQIDRGYRYEAKIAHVALSDSSERDKFTFDGTEEEKKSITGFSFDQISKIDYIPVEIFTEFPNLKRYTIMESKIPILKENLFTIDFEKIEGLGLSKNGIKVIERKAFFHLKNLVLINLISNKIESIGENIFKTNSKLEVVVLLMNQIISLNPVVFKNLNHLEQVHFLFNRCVSQDFSCKRNCLIDHEELNNGLTPCYINCIEDQECTAKSKTWIKELSCKFYESELRVVLPKLKFCQVSGIDFSFSTFDQNFTFTGPENKLKETTAVEIKQSPKLDFVPVEMIQKFPSLQGLKITFLKLEILRENFFNREFENITYLDLSSNRIQQVFGAFKSLPELRWIILANNSIETIIYRVFKNNKKLEVIDLQENKIKMINIKLFLNLAELQVVDFRENECANELFVCENCYEKSRKKLSKCFKNCQEDRKCFLLSNDDEIRIENRTISCNYNGVDWDQKTSCFVTQENFEMPNNDSIISYRFSGTEDQKEKATAVYFELSLTVDFVPFEIFENFRKLDSIALQKCEILMIKNNLFTGQIFEQIKELRLNEDKIRFIETKAFVDFKNLEKIDLTNNKIRSINKETFAQNKKLKKAILTGNEIKLIHPEAFLNQKGVHVVMFGNQCFTDEAFNVREDLKTCYDNWNGAYEIIEEGKENVKIIIKIGLIKIVL
jgi:Leucine-rich repeat (LRR) protein